MLHRNSQSQTRIILKNNQWEATFVDKSISCYLAVDCCETKRSAWYFSIMKTIANLNFNTQSEMESLFGELFVRIILSTVTTFEEFYFLLKRCHSFVKARDPSNTSSGHHNYAKLRSLISICTFHCCRQQLFNNRQLFYSALF